MHANLYPPAAVHGGAQCSPSTQIAAWNRGRQNFQLSNLAPRLHSVTTRLIASNYAIFLGDNFGMSGTLNKAALATSYLLRSADYGVPIEIASTAKYISGGGVAIGGFIIDNGCFDWSKFPTLEQESSKWGVDTLSKQIRSSVARNVGACLSPHSAYFHMLGLETLSLRIDKSSNNAKLVAEYLNSHKMISMVNYPGLPD